MTARGLRERQRMAGWSGSTRSAEPLYAF